ncbi:MaoC/PaaZ C-terminal domain-containing protein [Actinomycetospora lutea]|uniref:MaoC/PaaZ C-terminal domain-containing protein n=1 Tax=Actinomycetospora lutea TaxID=663604 RepID=UPI002366B945|nr:MaoC/PaaZ C-terminal domain-containing protein [Actinomycetospora lutea]MDD7942345.1 MaoC/PaaZ C-terminal domain-containing protein [Actinomycetospora lutea]
MADRWFEDFVVGERWTSPPREVTAEDLAAFTRVSGDDHPLHAGPDAILQGPFGVAVAMGLLQGLGLHGEAVLGLLDTHWAYRRPVRVGDLLTLEVTIVRARRTSAGDRGVVTRAMALTNQDGETVQDGTTAALIAARGPGPDPDGRAFGTVGWAEALTEKADLADEVASWDGTVGLRCGDDEVHLRVYRGRVIEVARRSPRGATFTLGADAATWLELVEAPDNPFMRLAMAGRFTVTGDGYEYLRLTSALHRLADAAREIA